MRETIKSNLIDIQEKKIYPVVLTIKNKKIFSIKKINEKLNTYILPGFIDSHVHIESSMLIPTEFAKLTVTHGTVATISDPHEIANVLGLPGVYFMLNNAKKANLKFYFGASPCVPATKFETNGATLGVKEIEELLENKNIYFLSEVMNYPGVISNDEETIAKIKIAKKYNKPIDGHCPGLRGKDLTKYIKAGIQTDHESYSYEEAKEKLLKGLKIQIREGSAAKNFEALHPLIDEFHDNLMFCCDDLHPNDLLEKHINNHVVKSINYKHDLFDVLKIACINPVKHYGLDVGLLKEGDPADFIEIDSPKTFKILKTFVNGKCVFNGNIKNHQSGKTIKIKNYENLNNFKVIPKHIEDLKFEAQKTYRIIKAIDGQLITKEEKQNFIDNETLYLAVVNRYEDSPPATAFIKGFGLQHGAIASSIAHDSHNIVAVGTNKKDMLSAINKIIENKGGIATAYKDEVKSIKLEIAGLMSTTNAKEIAQKYAEIDKYTKTVLKSSLTSPFITLSFMALLVIPEIKLSDKGLFDSINFKFIRYNE